MYPISPSEHLIESRICKKCQTSFPITDIDQQFLDRLAPIVASQKISLPFPTLCPMCRKLARLAWRNEKKLYKRKCDGTGKDMISLFPPTAENPIYSTEYWNSNSWDAKKYGKDFDPSAWFFDQFGELMKQVPLPGTSIWPWVENSEYSWACSWITDCYLTFSAQEAEKVHYSVDVVGCKDSMDCLGIMNSQNCYECIEVYDSYDIMYSYNVKNSRNSRFLLDCDGCSDCYGCISMTNMSFCLYNTPYSASEYKAKLAEILKLSMSQQKWIFKEFSIWKYQKKPLPNTWSENVIECENVIDSKNISFSRHIRGGEDIRHSQKIQVPKAELCMDSTSIGNNASRIYSTYQGFHNAHNIYFSAGNFHEVSHLFYSAYCRNWVNNCFGCVGLRHGESYCILNKQYTKESYESLVLKIIEHMVKNSEWGEFFPASLSPIGYTDSVCQILYPLSRSEAIQFGYRWSEYEAPFPTVSKIIPASKLPEDIRDIPDDILNWAIECEMTKKPFRIMKSELEFYRKHALPIPRNHPDQRYLDRLAWHMNY